MRAWQMLLTRLADWPERRESSKLNLPGRRHAQRLSSLSGTVKCTSSVPARKAESWGIV